MRGWYDSIYTGPGGATGAPQGGYQAPVNNFAITGGYMFQPAVGMQLSVGSVLRDLGDFIVTTAGETLRVVIDEWGRRLVMKTGEVLARTPLGPATAAGYAQQTLDRHLPLIVGGGLLLVALIMRR